ncbi:DUF3553 domain-containing protein [Cellulomonas septica]|uniref:DUF3553 domain-containing protein n=1 Tax=Cellulomonas septica TaxID=285080 RepID=UPI001B3538C0|nr:DUF3553 domain-containing protein [Cellulomonas septica]
MSTFTRLTLVGAERRAEVVVPSDEGVAAMLPQLLELLGEVRPDPCGACDSCDRGTSAPARSTGVRPGQAVRHERFGDGTVSVVEADRLTVLFEEHGYVTLDAAVALDSELLTVR